MKNQLESLRKQIDEIDESIIILLAKRQNVVSNVGKYKKSNNLPPLDKNRWQAVIRFKKLLAKKHNISEKMIEKIWETIHHEALKVEKIL